MFSNYYVLFYRITSFDRIFCKQMILTTALDNQNGMLVLTGVFTSVIGAVYYLTIIKTIYFDRSQYMKFETYTDISTSSVFSIILSIINLVIVLFILISNEILDLSTLLAIISYS